MLPRFPKKSALLTLGLCAIAASRLAAQGAVSSWIPTHVGDRWIYRVEQLDGGTGGIANPAIERSQIEQTIVGSQTIPEGELIVLRIRVLDAVPQGVPQQQQDEAWLIRGNCVYTRAAAQGLKTGSRQLSDDYRKELLNGGIGADFCFPLRIGETWGAPNWPVWRKPAEAQDWKVIGTRAADPAAPDKGRTYHITSLTSFPLGSGMSEDIWLEKGVGVVVDKSIHHGTFWEERRYLVSFKPGA